MFGSAGWLCSAAVITLVRLQLNALTLLEEEDMVDEHIKHDAAENTRVDELVATIRAALAPDAGTEVRSAGAIACRAILGALDPASRANAGLSAIPASPAVTSPTSTSAGSASPIAALLGTIGQIPRDQLLEVVGGLRWLLGQQGPTYLTRPTPIARPPGGSRSGS